MTERCSLWSALSAAACCFYRGSFMQVQVSGAARMSAARGCPHAGRGGGRAGLRGEKSPVGSADLGAALCRALRGSRGAAEGSDLRVLGASPLRCFGSAMQWDTEAEAGAGAGAPDRHF